MHLHMNRFSTQRYCGAFYARLSTLLLCLLSFTLGHSLSAQETQDPYRGTWLIDTPEDGSLILMVKRNNRASYFLGDNADRTVYQGTWEDDGESILLKWDDGSTHRIGTDALGIIITHSDANAQEHYQAQATKVPREALGQWAKPPTKEEEIVSARDKAKGFFGIWEIRDADKTHYVIIESNRSAATTWNNPTHANGLRGSWAKQGSELHIAWDSGHYSILRQDERTFSYKRIAPGNMITKDDSAFSPASRTDRNNLPAEWALLYSKERATYSGGIAFAKRKDALAFYRGSWIVKHSDTAYEYITIGRFGGLSTTRAPSLSGSWRMTGQDIFMRWDDGLRKVLSPIGRGFVLYEYKPGRPLDGVPNRLFPTTPADSEKLAKHLKGREDVSQQILALTEAAGISSDAPGWGETFMRWAWPFNEDEQAHSTNLLLEEGYGEPASQDPWWWPLWSEQAAITVEAPAPEITETILIEEEIIIEETVEVEATDGSTELVEAITEEVIIEEAAPTKPQDLSTSKPQNSSNQKPLDRSHRPDSKKKWKWPF